MKKHYKLVFTKRTKTLLYRIWRDEITNSTYIYGRALDENGNIIEI